MNTPPPTPSGLLTILTLAILAPGCASRIDPALAGPSYPAQPQARVLDIQAVPSETTLRFTNTTAESFGPARLWINAWYSRRLEQGLAVGQTLELPLASFRDEHGQAFRAGGFFATERPEVVVLVQLQPDVPQSAPPAPPPPPSSSTPTAQGPLLGFVVVSQP